MYLTWKQLKDSVDFYLKELNLSDDIEIAQLDISHKVVGGNIYHIDDEDDNNGLYIN
jgi:hypothetical protein